MNLFVVAPRSAPFVSVENEGFGKVGVVHKAQDALADHIFSNEQFTGEGRTFHILLTRVND